MALRSLRERILQSLSYEAGGLLLATPAYSFVFGSPVWDSAILVLAIAAAAIVWAGIHNTIFDVVELKVFDRLASDRPQAWRLAHALSNEATSTIVTLPVIMLLGGYGFWSALALDVSLAAFYAVYAFVFHFVYDRLRPVRRFEVITYPAPTDDSKHSEKPGERHAA